ncbi:NADH-dependent flavin oxidoreductase nadA [Ditylenchus destructor]|uniref:NADH-dependent flavin oxidoreductase nadA n=1 Tax=Ditylenchus destructor TaxID=166010 RepID=A0AAD4MKP6_9BILA|nr:NADH-dependent flavin oxidoreductase nadA [Ditylenchus destructor]
MNGYLAKSISNMPSRYETKEKAIPKLLGKGLKLPHSGHVLKNRFYKVPMSEYIAVADKSNPRISGIPSKVFANMFEKWAAGGYALISTGAIFLDETGLAMIPGNLMINPEADSAERRAGFKAIPRGVKKHGSYMMGQLMNFGDQMAFCNATNDSEKEAAFEKTKYAIKYLYESGFDGANFVLVFVPSKEGEKGPDLDKVGALIDAMAAAKRSVIPESANFALGIKLSTAKLQPFSVNFDDFVKIAKKIEYSQYDYIELAGGNYEYPYEKEQKDQDREAFYRKVIDEVKHQVKSIPFFGTGGFRAVSTMEKMLKDGKLDGIGLARPAAAEFDFPQKVLSHQIQGAKWNPFEQDMETGVMAGAAQMNQAGMRSLSESNGNPNYGVMDLTNEKTLEKFNAAKKDFLEKAAEIKKQEQWAWGVIVLTT